MRVFLLFSTLCLFCFYSCNPRVDIEIWVDYVVENQCSDTVVMKLYRTYLSPDSVAYFSCLERLNPEHTANSTIIIDTANGLITIPTGATVKYVEMYGSSRKKNKLDVEAYSQHSIEWIFTDSVTLIFSDGSSTLHTLNGTTANNILKRESYTRSGDTFTYYITEADHQAALSAGK